MRERRFRGRIACGEKKGVSGGLERGGGFSADVPDKVERGVQRGEDDEVDDWCPVYPVGGL